MSAVIRQHNSSILKDRKTESENFAGGKSCNCRVKDNCPLHGKCQVQSVVYKATVTTTNDEKDYTGLTAQTFKQRYNSHQHLMCRWYPDSEFEEFSAPVSPFYG